MPPGSGWAQEDGDEDPEPENYNYDDDDDEEEEEETNMIPGSRDRGTPAEGPAFCSAQSIPYLSSLGVCGWLGEKPSMPTHWLSPQTATFSALS